jgi:HK97 gp10 family phage protein
MSAFKITGVIKNVKRFEMKLKALERETKAGSIKAVQDSIFLIHKTAVESIQDNASGIPQVRYTNGRKRNVLASKPGDPPNTDTGRLVQSIKFDFQNGGLTGRVGTNLKYGAWLEFGTKNVEPRPWLSSAIKETAKQVGDIFKKAIQASIKGVTK